MSDNYTPRRKRLDLSRFDTMQMHVRHPLVAVWWAMSFAGFGQMMVGSYVKGYVLVLLEIIINLQAQLNLAIIYSFTGRFELAKAAVDTRWLLGYVLIYVYGIWDSYNLTVNTNKLAVLAAREKAPIDVFKMIPFSINYLDKRVPWVSLFWSFVLPGLGHMYILRMATGYFLIFFWLICAYYSRIYQVLQFTLMGDFSQAIAVTDPQWLLFIPSIYGYATYEAYSSTVELNKIFEIELREFLQKRYQAFALELPILKTKEAAMVLITATFDHSQFVELAITELEEKGISKEKILAIPLVQEHKNFAILDTIHRADGVSIFDTASVFATTGMTLGVIYGLIWTWGPIIWGLIGLFGGSAVGFVLDYLLTKRKISTERKAKESELVLIVSCEQEQSDLVEKILRNNTAFGVGKVTM
jgi:TM2 domain-containing membrane protein YozV